MQDVTFVGDFTCNVSPQERNEIVRFIHDLPEFIQLNKDEAYLKAAIYANDKQAISYLTENCIENGRRLNNKIEKFYYEQILMEERWKKESHTDEDDVHKEPEPGVIGC